MSQLPDEPSAASNPRAAVDPVAETNLERVLREVPRGAMMICGIAVTVLLLAWLWVYFGIFLPRGPVS